MGIDAIIMIDGQKCASISLEPNTLEYTEQCSNGPLEGSEVTVYTY